MHFSIKENHNGEIDDIFSYINIKFCHTQHNITTKEFVIFKNSSDTNIDISQLFDIESNQYN